MLPTGRSLLVALALMLGAAGAYFAARNTSVFSVQTIEVRGGTPAVRAQVESALAPERGTSLLRVGGGVLAQRLDGVSGVQSFRYDRRFPHTLEVVIRAERPVLVLRQGTAAYLVAADGRVLRTLAHPRLSGLPRLWVTHQTDVRVGEQLPPAGLAAAVALAPLRAAPLPGGVRTVESSDKVLNLDLGSGFQVRLGDLGDLRLKLAIARRLLHMTGAAAGAGYLDVSVPERPVLNTNPQVTG